MSSNNDNAMARFLFAILEQKNLKDIDWNKVAHNPVLSQQITNGHAARMRYSRFKSSILGIEPQRRNRTTPNKSKVTKSKKEPKTKKEKEEPIKPDPSAAPSAQQGSKAPSPTVKNEALVKNEYQQTRPETQLSPAELHASCLPDTRMQFNKRLLTPCSDTDLFAASHGWAASPASEMLHHEPTFDYAGAAAHCAAHEHASWQPSPSYSPFPLPALAPYEMDSYNSASPFCDHQHTPHPEEFGIDPSAMMPPDQDHIPVKHEEWDSHFQ